ncbi:hypothetical protein V3C99_009090 [Haemonchus contortus]
MKLSNGKYQELKTKQQFSSIALNSSHFTHWSVKIARCRALLPSSGTQSTEETSDRNESFSRLHVSTNSHEDGLSLELGPILLP